MLLYRLNILASNLTLIFYKIKSKFNIAYYERNFLQIFFYFKLLTLKNVYIFIHLFLYVV